MNRRNESISRNAADAADEMVAGLIGFRCSVHGPPLFP